MEGIDIALTVGCTLIGVMVGLLFESIRRVSNRLDDTNRKVGDLRVLVSKKVGVEWMNGKMDKIWDELKEIRERLPPKRGG